MATAITTSTHQYDAKSLVSCPSLVRTVVVGGTGVSSAELVTETTDVELSPDTVVVTVAVTVKIW
jgi:hypothetical protein